MKFPAYPNYKPSGVEWLGEVPEHWGVWKLRHVCRFAYGDSLASEDRAEGEVPVYGSNGPVGSHIVPNTERPVIIIGRKGSHGKVNFSAVPIFAIDTTYIIDYRHTSSDLRWLFHTLSALKLDAISKDSAVPGLAREDAYAYSAPSPTLFEQRAIADFLDRETAKIDTLVAKKRILIERRKEKRTALISRTVTRGLPPDAARQAGLDPHPKLKPTGLSACGHEQAGIDWLGEVPEHWEIAKVRHCFQNLDHRRFPVSGEDRSSLEKIYPYYGASGIIDYVDEYLFGETLILVAEDGANLLSRSTPLAFLATGKYWVNNHAHILKPVFGDIRYWLGVLQAYDYTPLVTGAAQPKLTSERLGSIALPQPPSGEQRAIADFLAREIAKIAALVAKVETAIERLQEYRAALISAAVTGKIDVRESTSSRDTSGTVTAITREGCS